jgi:hypothetical protein
MRPEDQLQKTVAKLLDATGLVWSASANGAFLQGNAQQRAIRGMRMKQHGVKNGIPDCMIFQPFRKYGDVEGFAGQTWQTVNGLALELKVGKNKPTPTQQEWADKLRACSWRVEVCRSMDEVLAVLRECYPDRFPK